jgi:hypothetical protein
VAEEVEFGNSEHTLLQIEGQPIDGKNEEQCPQVLPVLVLGFAVHSIIIKVDNDALESTKKTEIV